MSYFGVMLPEEGVNDAEASWRNVRL